MENKVAKVEFVGIIAYILLIISAFLSWADLISLDYSYYSDTVSVLGIEGNGNFVLIFGILGLIGLVYGYMYYNRKLSAVLMVIFSVLSLLVLIRTYNDVGFGIDGSYFMVLPGGGFILAGMTSFVLFFSGILLYPLSKKDLERKNLKEKNSKDRYCPNCGRAIPFDAKICPYCGKKFEDNFPIELE